MKNLAHRQGHVAVFLEILGQGGIVSCMDSPVGVEIIEPGGVGPAASQE